MLEEVYFSDLCTAGNVGPNPQNVWYDHGKFHFNYPALWYQSSCQHKAIGLRKIKCRAKAYVVPFSFTITRKPYTGLEYKRLWNFSIQILPSDDIEYIMKKICSDVNYTRERQLKGQYMGNDPPTETEYFAQLQFMHDGASNEVYFYLVEDIDEDLDATTKKFTFTFGIEPYKHIDPNTIAPLYKLLGKPPASQ